MKRNKVASLYLLKGNGKMAAQEETAYAKKLLLDSPQGVWTEFPLPEFHAYLVLPEQKKEECKLDYLSRIREWARKWTDRARASYQYQWRIEDLEWNSKEELYALIEGWMLSSYSFDLFKKDQSRRLELIEVKSSVFGADDLERCRTVAEEVNWVKDLVERPYSCLNAKTFAKEMAVHVSTLGIETKMWSRKEIEKAYMGGLLGVNQGSAEDPTFTEMVYHPQNARNKKPIVFVGKGVVFDAGGMNIKTGSYMEDMKTDMAGGAMAAGIIAMAARFQWPLYIVALVPATDNRLNGNALVPGDILRIGGETSVEIVNTDAEGRLLLADAVNYGQKHYQPACMVSMATLTGSASRALGVHGIVAMEENCTEKMKQALFSASEQSQERYWFFPMWKEYEKELESSVADLKNCGSPSAGMISAAKFVAHFTTCPFLHLDVAGVAYLEKAEGAWQKGATGMGVRWMVSFLEEWTKQSLI